MNIFTMLSKLLNLYQIKRNPIRFARNIGVTVGERCKFVSITGGTFGTEPYLIEIGDHVEVSFNVRFVTHDGGVWVARDEQPDLDVFGRITIGDNVFIGAGSIILPGTIIEDDCVIGAGSVVRGLVPRSCVYAGVPARYIKSTSEYIQKSLRFGVPTKLLTAREKREFLNGWTQS